MTRFSEKDAYIPDTVGMTAICGRVIFRMRHGTLSLIGELTLSEAKQVKVLLDRCIGILERCDGMSHSFSDFMGRIPTHPPEGEPEGNERNGPSH